LDHYSKLKKNKMKKTKLLVIGAFVIALSSAFTSKHIPFTLQTVREAVTGAHLPCDLATADCGLHGGICTDLSGNITFYPVTPTMCQTPLQKQ
jgi:hypothetical protein